jgi:hypothetical protein
MVRVFASPVISIADGPVDTSPQWGFRARGWGCSPGTNAGVRVRTEDLPVQVTAI